MQVLGRRASDGAATTRVWQHKGHLITVRLHHVAVVADLLDLEAPYVQGGIVGYRTAVQPYSCTAVQLYYKQL